MRILLVDDDDITLDLLATMLQEAGHEVVSARHGREAQEILAKGDIHFVISDWLMPEMDGLQLCRWIREQMRTGYTYIILLTSQNRTEDIVQGLSAGADDFIAKPFDPAELAVRVKVGERILSIETRHVAIFALAKLAESRDPETGQHLERMREYASLLARAVSETPAWSDQLSANFTEMIYLTSPLHDIGKVGIPDGVLLKPGRLTDREFEIMKTHTAVGGDTLAAAVQQYPTIEYLCMARDIALGHHERYDGSGYPLGLCGDTIPLCARITALADVYDALTSKRVYKGAYTHEVARTIVSEGKGAHFDPLLVELFLEHEEAFIAIRDRYSEPGEG
ncbi:MAG TPA: HD domain-containing phosphohydrolase [Armatimonadota bacterium]|jgi:putative two-component system response regulator